MSEFTNRIKEQSKAMLDGLRIELDDIVKEKTLSNSETKYELVNESIKWRGHTARRIRALRSFGDVRVGDLGGYIESEKNLSQSGRCWVYDSSIVLDNARVLCNAKITEMSVIMEDTEIKDDVVIIDSLIKGALVLEGSKSIHGTRTDDIDVSIETDTYICNSIGQKARIGDILTLTAQVPQTSEFEQHHLSEIRQDGILVFDDDLHIHIRNLIDFAVVSASEEVF
jgi:NDP-sugar pyrophosphorylase family protein